MVLTGLLRAAAIDLAAHEREARAALSGASRAAGFAFTGTVTHVEK